MFQHLERWNAKAAHLEDVLVYLMFWPGVYTLWIVFCHLSRQMAMFFRKNLWFEAWPSSWGKVRSDSRLPIGVAVVNQIHTHYMGISKNRGSPKWMVYDGKALLKWMIWGYHYFWKHPHQESEKLQNIGCSWVAFNIPGYSVSNNDMIEQSITTSSKNKHTSSQRSRYFVGPST